MTLQLFAQLTQFQRILSLRQHFTDGECLYNHHLLADSIGEKNDFSPLLAYRCKAEIQNYFSLCRNQLIPMDCVNGQRVPVDQRVLVFYALVTTIFTSRVKKWATCTGNTVGPHKIKNAWGACREKIFMFPLFFTWILQESNHRQHLSNMQG